MTVVTLVGICTHILLIGGGRLKAGLGGTLGTDKLNPGITDQGVLIFIYINKMSFIQICDT